MTMSEDWHQDRDSNLEGHDQDNNAQAPVSGSTVWRLSPDETVGHFVYCVLLRLNLRP